MSFYRVALKASDAELARLSGLNLVPGMPVEAFLQTGQRTVFSYLTKLLNSKAASFGKW